MDQQLPQSWTTDQMRLLDSRELLNKTVQLSNGAPPGTNKPFDGTEVSGKIVEMLLSELKEAHGVHVETVLAVLGALSGFSVQMQLREFLIKPGKMAAENLFVAIKTKSGNVFYSGDLCNEALFGKQPGVLSVYALVGKGVVEAGGKDLPDIENIARHVVNTIGSDTFGLPRVPEKNMPHAPPIQLLDRFWNPIRNFMALTVTTPLQWHFVLSHAAQKTIVMGKEVLDPSIAGRLVMETAVAMAKIDPKKVRYASFESS